MNLPCESSGWSLVPVGDVCIGASWAECFHGQKGPLTSQGQKGKSPLTSEVVWGDWCEYTSNTLQLVDASKSSKKIILYEQADWPLFVGKVLLKGGLELPHFLVAWRALVGNTDFHCLTHWGAPSLLQIQNWLHLRLCANLIFFISIKETNWQLSSI